MNSIYEQLNKINDKESLSEKYNVKNVKELKKLQESRTCINEDRDAVVARGMSVNNKQFKNSDLWFKELFNYIKKVEHPSISKIGLKIFRSTWEMWTVHYMFIEDIRRVAQETYDSLEVISLYDAYNKVPYINEFNSKKWSMGEDVYRFMEKHDSEYGFGEGDTYKLSKEDPEYKYQHLSEWDRMKEFAEDADGRSLVYDGPYADYIDNIYLSAFDAASKGTDVTLTTNIELGHGNITITDGIDSYTWDFEEDCENVLDMVNSSKTSTIFKKKLIKYFQNKIANIDNSELTESSNDKQDVRHEAQRIHDELIKKGYTNDDIDSIIRILHTASINNFEPARPKLKAAFPDLDI